MSGRVLTLTPQGANASWISRAATVFQNETCNFNKSPTTSACCAGATTAYSHVQRVKIAGQFHEVRPENCPLILLKFGHLTLFDSRLRGQKIHLLTRQQTAHGKITLH
jgi:hypothetical protein